VDEATRGFKYLAIKNWRKYQGPTLKHANARRPWVKDWLDKDADPDYSKLTCLQRYVLDGCRRLRGRFENNLPNDPVWVSRALSVDVRERHCIPSAIHRLIAFGFLLPTNQQLDSDEPDGSVLRGEMRGDDVRGDDVRGDARERKSPPASFAASSPDRAQPDQNRPSDEAQAPDVALPPETDRRVLEAPGHQETPREGLTAHQLARGMMETLGKPGGQSDLGIWSQAIELKARKSGMSLAEAYRFILAKAEEAEFRGEFNKPTFWMKDAAYDHKPPARSNPKNEKFRERVRDEFASLDRQRSRASGA